MARDPVPIETIFTEPEQHEKFYTAILRNDIETFKTMFEENDLQPEDTIDGLPLTFYAINAHRFQGLPFLSVDVFLFLVEQGADLNYRSLQTLAATYSREFHSLDDADVDVYTTLAMNAAVKGDLDLLIFLYNQGADLTILTETEAMVPIPGEDALRLAEKRLEDLDRSIHNSMAYLKAVKENPALGRREKEEYISQTEESLNGYSKDRISIMRVLKWLRNITVNTNIPSAVTKKQYSAYRNVLSKKLPLGNLELNAFSKFIPKPAKFRMPRNLNRVNTTLFQGGRKKTRRTAQKKRKTRSNRR